MIDQEENADTGRFAQPKWMRAKGGVAFRGKPGYKVCPSARLVSINRRSRDSNCPNPRLADIMQQRVSRLAHFRSRFCLPITTAPRPARPCVSELP